MAGDLSLRESEITGWAWLENLQVGSDLFLQASKLAKADLPGSTIAGNLVMTGASLSGPLNMNSAKIGGDLLLDGKGGFQAVTLADADIGSNLRLDGSHVAGALAMPAVHVGHLLALGRAAIFDDEVELPLCQGRRRHGAEPGANSPRACNLDGVTIGQSLSITEDASIVGPLQHDLRPYRRQSRSDRRAASIRSTSPARPSAPRSGWRARAMPPSAGGRAPGSTLRNVSAKALQDLPEAWPDRARSAKASPISNWVAIARRAAPMT